MEELKISVIAFITGFMFGCVLIFVIMNFQTSVGEYYGIQAKEFCQMSNNYRELLLLKNPELTFQVPAEVDCDAILFLNTTAKFVK